MAGALIPSSEHADDALAPAIAAGIGDGWRRWLGRAGRVRPISPLEGEMPGRAEGGSPRLDD
ncbi:unnamed protein product [Ciceribacter selenitireducens ATCC BAA-1503]|uniref:Propionyl-coenzyme A carboxylase alpha polypeptide n=1 Tax=Ciceribacter selenitireducens ATCC BAA-1503 TaxID=1336235 RepID=A0A376AKQ9_9HYPH|nr:unnamed protein product [Ciceribacter selenitireducens ATCC BAA-1503]